MNKEEARHILQEEIVALREKKYAELRRLVDPAGVTTRKTTGKSGVEYQIETIVFWDDPRELGGNLRVIVCIDDGGWRAFLPLSDDFIISPDESFVGE